jgi:hypothetical protein
MWRKPTRTKPSRLLSIPGRKPSRGAISIGEKLISLFPISIGQTPSNGLLHPGSFYPGSPQRSLSAFENGAVTALDTGCMRIKGKVC